MQGVEDCSSFFGIMFRCNELIITVPAARQILTPDVFQWCVCRGGGGGVGGGL